MKTTADQLRTSLIGAWTLQSYESSALDGSDVSYPLGVDARGFIMYTPDGYMSAQLMRAGRTPFDGDDPHHAHDNELAAIGGIQAGVAPHLSAQNYRRHRSRYYSLGRIPDEGGRDEPSGSVRKQSL